MKNDVEYRLSGVAARMEAGLVLHISFRQSDQNWSEPWANSEKRALNQKFRKF